MITVRTALAWDSTDDKGVLSSALGEECADPGGSWRHMGTQPVGCGRIQEPSTQTSGLKGEVMAYEDGEEEGLREDPGGSDSLEAGRRKATVWCLRIREKGSHEQSTG